MNRDMNLLNYYLIDAVSGYYDMVDRSKNEVGRCYERWAESRNFPRKKKKRERKLILIDFQIFSYASTIFQ